MSIEGCCLLPKPVRDVATALGAITETQIRAQFDPLDLGAYRVYPGGWLLYRDEPLLSRKFERLWARFQGMTTFFQATASDGDAVISWLQ